MARIVNIILCLVHFFLSDPELFTQFPEVPNTTNVLQSARF
jgi:hypothetical protein